MTDATQSFFTFQSFGTLAGASVGVIVLSNTYRTLRQSDSVYPPFVASLIIGFFAAYESKALFDIAGIALAFLNSCLLFCTALGMNQSIVGLKNQGKKLPGEITPQARVPVPWFSPWIKARV